VAKAAVRLFGAKRSAQGRPHVHHNDVRANA
jgi:hypothetical protein